MEHIKAKHPSILFLSQLLPPPHYQVTSHHAKRQSVKISVINGQQQKKAPTGAAGASVLPRAKARSRHSSLVTARSASPRKAQKVSLGKNVPSSTSGFLLDFALPQPMLFYKYNSNKTIYHNQRLYDIQRATHCTPSKYGSRYNRAHSITKQYG